MSSGLSSDPPDRRRWARGDNGGSFFVFRSADPEALAALREEIGEEAFGRWQRDSELARNPRPLTEAERAVLRQAAGPLLADLAASGLSMPDIREEAHEEREEPSACGWIQGPGGTGHGIYVLLNSPAADQVAQLAEQFQHWAADQLLDAGLSPEWPACPHHPSPPRRLEPQVRDGRAAWVCREGGQVIWPVGELAMPGGARRGKRGHRP